MSRRPSALFLSHSPREEQGSRFYRCALQAKQLAAHGWDTRVEYVKDARASAVKDTDLIIASRLSFDEQVVLLLRETKRAGKALCGDLDNRLSPWDIDDTGYMRSRRRPKSSVSARKAAAERDMLRLLPAFEQVAVSTDGIREQLAGFGVAAHVVPNVFDTDVHPGVLRPRRALSRLLVMSGTQTHDADLRFVAPQLGRFLSEHRDVQCTLLGQLQVPGPLLGLPNLVTRGLLPIAELYAAVEEHDLCLVPLEPTAFNDCKSALKFIECGAVSVPVLASPRRDYRRVIQHGRNGFLAEDDPQSFYARLCELKSRPELLGEASAQAYLDIMREHTLSSRGSLLADHFRAFLAARSEHDVARGAGV